MRHVIRVQAEPDYVLQLVFDNGVTGKLCIKDRLFGPVFEPLKDPDYFRKVFVDEFGAVCWPNQADLAPDALYLDLTGQQRGLETG